MDAGASFDLFGFDSEFTVLTKNESMTVSSWSICLPTADYVFDPCCSSPSCTFWSSGNYSLYVEDSLIFESNRYHPYLFAIDAIPAPTTSPTSSPTLSPTAAPITLCADPNLRRYDVVLDGDNMNFQLYELGVNDTLITSHNAPGRYSGCVTDGKEYFWSLASLSMSPIRMKLFIDFSDIDYSYLENNGDTASSTFVLPFYADSPTAAPSVAPTSCSDHLFEIEISPDLFPEEISWVLLQTRPTNELVISSSNQSKPLTTQVCLTPGEYSFGIMDLFKDGICGAFGTGSYSLYLNGAMLHSGCDFGISDAYVFVIEPSEPTASPSRTPTATPSASPSASPSAAPSLSPSRTPTSSPSASPTYFCPSLDEYHMVLWLSGVNVTYTVFKFNEDDSTSVVFNASSSGQHDFCLSNGSYIHSMSTTSNLLARSRLTSVFFDEFEIVQQEIAINAVVKVVSDYFDLPYDSPPTVSPPVVVCNSTGLENTLSWSITPDYFPRDISWQLLNLQGAGAIASGSYGDSNHLEGSYCLANGRYSFGVMDKAADGLCCQWGPAGYWTLKMNGQSIIPSGIVSGDYLASYVVRFTVTDGVISNVVEI